MKLLERFMPGHKCEIYQPKDAKEGDRYKCMCGREYTCTRRWPWRKWVALATMIFLSGCSTMQTAADILDILVPDPVPVCDKESIGVEVEGKQCIKLSDDTYVWRAK